MGLSEGLANTTPERMYERLGGRKLFKPEDSMENETHIQTTHSINGLGDEMINAENNGSSLIEQLKRSIDEREEVDKRGGWNYEYGQAFVKTFMTMHGDEKYFELLREVGPKAKYHEMREVDATKEGMRSIGYTSQEIEEVLETTARTTMLKLTLLVDTDIKWGPLVCQRA